MDNDAKSQQTKIEFSHAEAKNKFAEQLVNEMENAADEKEVEQGARKFLEWLQSGKLELKAYPTANLHAKVYIMSFAEDDRDKGRVITGSSNFTQAGFVDNLEFNVELKTAADHTFAKEKFDELWADAVDIKARYIETIKQRTWLNDDITPYQLYLKFLYEYFEDELSQKEEINLGKDTGRFYAAGISGSSGAKREKNYAGIRRRFYIGRRRSRQNLHLGDADEATGRQNFGAGTAGVVG